MLEEQRVCGSCAPCSVCREPKIAPKKSVKIADVSSSDPERHSETLSQ